VSALHKDLPDSLQGFAGGYKKEFFSNQGKSSQALLGDLLCKYAFDRGELQRPLNQIGHALSWVGTFPALLYNQRVRCMFWFPHCDIYPRILVMESYLIWCKF
jgi:hypothetical protein